MKTFEIDGMVVHYGHDPSLKFGDYFYLPFEAMTPYIVNNSKRVEGYVGIYKWYGRTNDEN
jgi:hypothetical protein